MIDVAMRDRGSVTLPGFLSGKDIVVVPRTLFGKLRRHGLVASVRGPGGGYRLARPAGAVSVADVILAVDEPIDATQCGGKENCLDDRRCMTHELWAGLNTHIFAFLRSVTLEELVRQQERPEVNVLHVHRSPPGKKREPATMA